MPTYTVKKPCRPDGRTYMTEGTIDLSEKQAKYLLLSGHLEAKATTKTKTPAPKRADTAAGESAA